MSDMNSNENKHTFKFKFQLDKSINQTKRSRIQKGHIDGEIYVQKIIQCKDKSQLLFYQKILLQRSQLWRQLHSQSMFQCKIVSQRLIEIDQVTRQEQIFLQIFSPFLLTDNLCKYTDIAHLNSLYPITFQQKCERVQRIVSKACTLLLRHTNQQLYSFQTFMFNQISQQLLVNSTSFVGMQLLMYDEQIPQTDFLQIFQLLGSSTLKKQPKNRFSVQLKFRAIGMLILNMIFQQHVKIRIDKKQWESTAQKTCLQKYIDLTEQLSKKFNYLLSIKKFKDDFDKIEKANKVKYYTFLKKIFVDQEELTWTEVIDFVIPKKYSQKVQTSIPFGSAQLAESIYKLNLKKQPNRDVFQLIGLKKTDSKLYFLILLADQRTHVEQLLKYENIDEYIYNPHHFNQQNLPIYKKILKLVADIFKKQQYQQSDKCQGEVFQPQNKTRKQNCTQLYLKAQQVKLANFEQFLDRLSINYGVYQTIIKDKKIKLQRHETKAIKAYKNIFK